MRSRHLIMASFAICLTFSTTASIMNAEQTDSRVRDGDRIVFLGDSITQAGARPGGYVSLIRDELSARRPDLTIEVIGAGISGHKVPDCQARLQRDVLDRSPTMVVIYIGINDVWHSTRNAGTSKEDYESGLKDMIEKIHDSGARVLLCTPSVIGEKTDGTNSLDELLDEYCEISREVAKETNVELLDLRQRFLDHLDRANSDNQPHSILTTDGVHLNERGNRFVANCMLESFGVADADPDRLLRHIVLFKFKDDASEDAIQEVVSEFAGLADKIDAIHDFEMGTENSPEGLADGFTHAFVVTFLSEEDRDIYLPHPEHEAFVELIGPSIDRVLVFDYWTK